MGARRIVRAAIVLVLAGVLTIVGWNFCQLGRKAPARAPARERATAIMVSKAARGLAVLHDGRVLKTFAVALASAPAGPKPQQGEGRTLEGAYAIDFKPARGRAYLALHISYPNAADRARDGAAFLPGRDIMIDGLPNGLELPRRPASVARLDPRLHRD